jgi:hypothetical protein
MRIEITETEYKELNGMILEGSVLNILDSREEWIHLPKDQKRILALAFEKTLKDCGFSGDNDIHLLIETVLMWFDDILPASESEFDSGELLLSGLWLLLLFYLDGILDPMDPETFPGGRRALQEIIITFLDIVEGKYGKDTDDINYPLYVDMPLYIPLCRLAKVVYANILVVYHNKDVNRYNNRIFKYTARILSSYDMKFSGECYSSEENFRAYHGDSSGALYSLSMSELVGRDCEAPEWLQFDCIYVRLKRLMQRLSCEMGDIIGIWKDLKMKEMDSVLIMKIGAGQDLKKAWKNMVHSFNSNKRDYIRLTNFLRNKYVDDEVLVRHFAAMDLLMHGSFRWSSLSKRYRLEKPHSITVSYREEKRKLLSIKQSACLPSV